MERRIVYLSRLTRLPLLSADGGNIGRVVDAVVDLGSKPPRINGVVVAMQRRSPPPPSRFPWEVATVAA